MKIDETFIKYVHARQTLTVDGYMIDLDSKDEALLAEIALAAKHNFPMPVTKLMYMRDIASPATIHKRLSRMVDAGIIERTAVEPYPLKNVDLTPFGAKVINELGKLMKG